MRRRLFLIALLAAVLGAATCTRGSEDSDNASDRGGEQRGGGPERAPPDQAIPLDVPAQQRGGTARVAVWGEPDPAAPTLHGAAVRALVMPQLFVARPDGRWAPWLVEPGTDQTADDARSARFRLRSAKWSDGTPITADDLRRGVDERFIEAVDGPAGEGIITVRFKQPLPGWRRLWSGLDTVVPPRPDLWGGPFVVASRTPGLETVLHRNPGWPGPGPFLDEVRLLLVPDAVMAVQLLEGGEVDVIGPPAYTARRRALDDAGAKVDSRQAGGWWVGLFVDADLRPERRQGLIRTVHREQFVETLLRDEAVVLNGFIGEEDAAWQGAGFPRGEPSGLSGVTVALGGEQEEPMTQLLHRSMQLRAVAVNGRIELAHAEADRVEAWLRSGEQDAIVAMAFDPPERCWRCRWDAVDADLAAAADAGDRDAMDTLQQRLRDENLLLPLWAPTTVVAWRGDLAGPSANGWGLSPAWNAWAWGRE